jgi:thiamine pyrophosphate-dependent acetolactate synthase large subunit-like protein
MLATSLLQGLKDHGAREIFGIPGDFVLPFFKVIEESGILPYYTLSHEPGVGFAADAAARYHAGLGVAVVTYGAGAFNLVNVPMPSARRSSSSRALRARASVPAALWSITRPARSTPRWRSTAKSPAIRPC